MNYFELYQVDINFKIDKNAIKSKFYELSKKFHPDFYINESIEKQNEILELSTLNNKAYQTLSNVEKLIPYILELKSILTKDENFQLPKSFLIEMMDINEALMELSFDDNPIEKDKLKSLIETKKNELITEMNRLFDEFELKKSSNANEILINIKNVYYKQKYISNLTAKI
ncbi:MAG: Fe-S protein assembly co-chaperone HscB [Sphingobacteriaceae bacterium]|nr:Fe-S protein assembly co-chaperone HscB [Sphingobacteriaceae bacterium]